MNIIVEVSEEVKSSQYDRVQFLGLISRMWMELLGVRAGLRVRMIRKGFIFISHRNSEFIQMLKVLRKPIFLKSKQISLQVRNRLDFHIDPLLMNFGYLA